MLLHINDPTPRVQRLNVVLNEYYEYGLLFFVASQPQWARASSLSRFFDHTQTHHTGYHSSGLAIGISQRPLPDNTQYSQETDTPMPPAGFEPAKASSRRPTP